MELLGEYSLFIFRHEGIIRLVGYRKDGREFVREIPELQLSLLSKFAPDVAKFLFDG